MSRTYLPKDLSRALTKALRHQPSYLSLGALDEGGWASLDLVLAGLKSKGWSVTREQVAEAAAHGPKRRLQICLVTDRIRAMQGHSIDVPMHFKPEEPPKELYHGTSRQTLPKIMTSGICKMERQYVHLSADLETARSVGARHGTPAVVTVDARRMWNNGELLYLADNGVWLVDYVHPNYFKDHVVPLTTGAMKRFLVFSSEHYYPEGYEDLVGHASSLAAAERHAISLDTRTASVIVVDTHLRTTYFVQDRALVMSTGIPHEILDLDDVT